MQVPDSFYFNKPAAPELKKEAGQRRHLGDDSFRQIMAHERTTTKNVDEERKGKTKSDVEGSGAAEEVAEQDEEFSIFATPKKKKANLPVRERQSNGGGRSKAPFFDQPAVAKNAEVEEKPLLEEEIAVAPDAGEEPTSFEEAPIATPISDREPLTQEKNIVKEDPSTRALRQGHDLNKPHEAIVAKQQQPDAVHQQEQLDDIRNNAGFIFVEKKDKKEELNRALFDYGSKSKPKSGETVRVVTTADGGEAEVVEVPTKEIVKGKLAIKEQAEEAHKDIALPGSKEGSEKFQHTLEKGQPEIRNAMGVADPRQEKIEQSKKSIEQPREGLLHKNAEEPETKKTRTSSEETAVDPRSIAFLPDGALPKERGEVALNSANPAEKPPLAPKLKEIVDQIIKEIYTINNDGKSETTIILQNPPLFNGVKVTIQSFEHARGELNITFSNLTGPGKRLLDENLASLKTALENNGRNYVVHQIVTTTLDEVPRYIAEAQQQQSKDEEGQQGGQQQGKEQEEQDQNEKE